MSTQNEPVALKSDLLWGAEQIADELGQSPRQVYHAAQKNLLPIQRVGARLVASRRELRRHLTALTSKPAEK
jgi:hypothetical protein